MPNEIIKSNKFKWAAGIVVGLVVLLLVFWLGVQVGERREDFRNEWGKNYGRFFGEPRQGLFGELPGGGPVNPYGNAGVVLNLSGNTIVIKGNDNVERTIVVSSSTVIREQAGNLDLGGIKPGDLMVAIGAPNGNGQIEARFIRVFPPMPAPSGPIPSGQ